MQDFLIIIWGCNYFIFLVFAWGYTIYRRSSKLIFVLGIQIKLRMSDVRKSHNYCLINYFLFSSLGSEFYFIKKKQIQFHEQRRFILDIILIQFVYYERLLIGSLCWIADKLLCGLKDFQAVCYYDREKFSEKLLLTNRGFFKLFRYCNWQCIQTLECILRISTVSFCKL